MATLIVPSVLVFVEETIDVSYIFDESEEEEQQGNEKSKDLEILIVDSFRASNELFYSKIDHNLVYTFGKYPKPHLNLIFSPPEFSL